MKIRKVCNVVFINLAIAIVQYILVCGVFWHVILDYNVANLSLQYTLFSWLILMIVAPITYFSEEYEKECRRNNVEEVTKQTY